MKKGFSLIEMLIVILILGIMLTSIYSLFNKLFSEYKIESKNLESEVESVVNVQLIVADITHAGLGLADDLSNLAIEWDMSTLTIRSTINVTNSKTEGWVLVDCTSGTWNELSKDNFSNFDSNTNMVFLNIAAKQFEGNGLYGVCPSSSILVGYPYDSDVSSGCSGQYCNIITYSLSQTQTIPYCNPGTKNLLRRTGGNAINGTGGSQVLNCVADFYVAFDYDTNNNGFIENSEKNIFIDTSATANDIKNKLKSVNVYILVQEGKKDTNYTYSGAVENSKVIFYDANSDGNCDADDICLVLPSDYSHYRWKKIFLKIIPKAL